MYGTIAELNWSNEFGGIASSQTNCCGDGSVSVLHKLSNCMEYNTTLASSEQQIWLRESLELLVNL